MKKMATFCFSFAILAFSFPLLVGIHLSKVELQRVVRSVNKESHLRLKRQQIVDPQQFTSPLVNAVIQVPLPTNIGYFPGAGRPVADQCQRDETLMEDGSCQSILTTGNCSPQEEVLMDPASNRGFCAPRICPPDRVFVPLTQLCHDPLDTTVCPPGRQLYYSAYGTAVCTCPDGTIEGDDDLDDDVCEPILGTTLQCAPGMYEYESMPVNYYNPPTYMKYDDSQDSESSYSTNIRDYTPKVFWFKDFNSPPQCLPDPCNGANINKKPDDLPFVPNEKGICFQLSQTEGACPYGKIYVLNLEKLMGECATLEDAGYNVFDPKVVESLKKMFGPTILPNTGAPFKSTYGIINQTIYGIYGPSNNLNEVTSGINSIYPNVQQSSNTIRPISSYQTPLTTNIQTIKNDNLEQQNAIDSFLNGFVSPFDQGPNVGKITHFNKGTEPSKQNHHQIVLGPNGISNTKKTEIYQAINLTNFLNNVVQSGVISQKPFSPQSTHSSNSQSSFVFQEGHPSSIQNPLSHQSTHSPFTQSNSIRPSSQQISQGLLIHQTNEQPFIPQNTQVPFIQINSQKPFFQDTVTRPIHQNNGNNVSPNVISPFINYEENKKFQSSRPFTSTSNSVSNIQKPSSGQGSNQGKEICTFVQNPNGQGGKKVCQFINAGQSFNSIEVPGQIGHNSPEILPGGQMPPPSLEILNGRGFESYGYRFGRSLGFKYPPALGLLTHHLTVFPTGEVVTHLQPLSRQRRDAEDEKVIISLGKENDDSAATENLLSTRKRNLYAHASPSNDFETRLLSCRPGDSRDINGQCKKTLIFAEDEKVMLSLGKEKDDSVATEKVLSRRKRNLYAHASPSNVFETRLLSCRPGGSRDINGKCKTLILPPRVNHGRGTRAAPPVPPTPSCPSGMAFNIRRMCVTGNTAQNSLVAFNLG